jgi:hypothetical protein
VTRTLPAKAGVRTLRSQNGQALIEFTIAAAALLVPLFLMLAYVAKYHDMQSATIQAARYAAWERTVYFGGETWECNYDETTFRAKNKPGGAKWACGTAWKSDADISNDVGRRFFKGSWLSEGLGDGLDERPFWSDLAGTPLLKDYQQGSLAGRTPGGPNLIVDKIYSEGLGTAAQFFSAEKLVKLDMANLYTSTVTFTPTNTWAVTQAFKNSNPLFDLKENNVLVANGWSANGKNFVAAQIQPYTPTNIVNNSMFDKGWSAFTTLASKVFPEFDNFKFTASLKPDNADKVPPDRLSGGAEIKPPKIVPPKPVRPPIAKPEAAFRAFHAERKSIDETITSCKAAKKAEMVRNYYEVIPPEQYTVWNKASSSGGCGQYTEGFTYKNRHPLREEDGACWMYSTDFANNNPTFCATSCEGTNQGCNMRWACVNGQGGWWSWYMLAETRYIPAGEKVAQRPWNGYTPNSDNDHNCNAGLDTRINALLPNLLNDQAVAGIIEACGAGIPEAARECAQFQALLDARRQERDRLISERDYMRQPLNSCSCAASRTSSCRSTGNTYTCQ